MVHGGLRIRLDSTFALATAYLMSIPVIGRFPSGTKVLQGHGTD